MKIDRILLTTDFSDHARRAYPCAVGLASKCDASLHLVHFGGTLPFADGIPRFGNTTTCEPLFDSLENALVKEASEHPAFNGFGVEPHLQRHRWTRTRQRELERKLGIDLIVTSPQGRTGLAKMLLGSFADRIVRHSSVPVLLFRPTDNEEILNPRTVLVPYDIFDRPQMAVSTMRWLDSQFNSAFRLLYVYDSQFNSAFRLLYVYDQTRASGQSIRGMEEHCESDVKNVPFQSAEERFAKIRDESLQGLKVTLETSKGYPSEQVVQRACDLPADLVLLSTHDGLGSVSRRVITEAKCSVLAVPMGEEVEKDA